MCSSIGGGCGVENEWGSEKPDKMPSAFYKLRLPNEKLKSQDPDETLLQCPQCGVYYLYHRWSPGGSEDAMKTVVHELVKPASVLEAVAHVQWLAEKEKNPAVAQELREGLELETRSFKVKAETIVREAIEHVSEKRSSFCLERAARILGEFLPNVRDPRQLLGRIAGLLEIAAVKETVLSALLKSFDRWAGNVEAVNAILDDIQKQNPGSAEVAQFVETMRKANKTIMDEAYRKMIRNLTSSYLTDGTVARCPQCRSTNVSQGMAAYEFTEMKCDDCGNHDVADDYQLEDWYPKA